MKYVQIPAAVDMPGFTRADKSPVKMSLHELLNTQVWTLAVWRSGKDMYELYMKLVKKFTGADKEGMWVGIENDDWDKAFPIITMRGEKLDPVYAVPVNELLGCLFYAVEEKPEGFEE